MPAITRRRFLRTTGIGLLGMSTVGIPALGAQRGPSTRASAAARTIRLSLPPHRSLHLPGVHAYAGAESVAAGGEIPFYVSGSVPSRLSICRLGLEVDDPMGDEVLHQFEESLARVQPIHPGSYVHITKGLPALKAFSLEAWVRPWKLSELVGVITQWDETSGAGFGLFLTREGTVAFGIGSGPSGSGRSMLSHSAGARKLKSGQWHHLVASWDGTEKALWIDGEQAGSWPWRGPAVMGRHPLRLGAAGRNGAADFLLDGDLGMAAIYRSALGAGQIHTRFENLGLKPASGSEVLACWTFSEERGERIADRSRHRRHGRLINHGTWMIGGPSFQAEVPRFEGYEPRKDPRRGHGLRLASDDLYDCGWEETHRLRLPPDARPGIYVGRLAYEWEGRSRLSHVTFVVRRRGRTRGERAKRAPILVLCASNTWRAYSGTPFPAPHPGLKQVWGTGGIANSPGDPPAYNFYRNHAAGQGTCQIGLRVPWPAAGPYVLYGGATDYSHLMRADRFAHIWLERAGYEFDVVTDLDLHRDPAQLEAYQVFLINGHSEYWSVPMYEGLRSYLRRGGNVICLSGNSLFWRVSYDADGTVLECRKVDAPGEQLPPSRRGECWHSQDGGRGGLLRECGYPGWKLIGLETLGWNNQSDPEQFGPYIVEEPDHFLFHQPAPVAVRKGDPIGQAEGGAMPRANGHEIDVRLSTLAALQEIPNPPGATMPSDPPGMIRLANGVIPWKRGGAAFDYFFRGLKPKTDQGGEMIYWERPEGGRVFNAGSIGSGWALAADPKFQRLLKNVLHHFGVPEKSEA